MGLYDDRFDYVAKAAGRNIGVTFVLLSILAIIANVAFIGLGVWIIVLVLRWMGVIA